MSYDIVGIGNALVDIQVRVDDEKLNELGFTKGGMTLTDLKEQREVLHELRGLSRSISSGGSAANTIHGLGALGSKTYYIGKIANDEFGKHYSEDMTNCSVGFPGPDADSHGTGTSLICITPDAQRTMVTNLGISSELHSSNVDTTILSGVRFVYIEGYLWTSENTREAAIKLAKEAKKLGIPVAFTLSDAFVIENFRDEIMDFLQWNVDILFCNEVEGTTAANNSNPEEAVHFLGDLCETVFFTRGEEGAWVLKQSHELESVKSFVVDAMDTTGAGDLFAAGALYGLLHGKSMQECAILGGYMAAQVVSHLGARIPAHSHKKIETIMQLYSEIE